MRTKEPIVFAHMGSFSVFISSLMLKDLRGKGMRNGVRDRRATTQCFR